MKIHTVDSKGAILLLAVALPDKFKHQRDLWFTHIGMTGVFVSNLNQAPAPQGVCELMARAQRESVAFI